MAVLQSTTCPTMNPYYRQSLPARSLRRLALSRWFPQIRLFLTLFAGLAALASSEAQTSATGSITGRVLDASTGRYLNNAQVTIAGTARTARTNEYGEYRFDNVPAGEVNIEAFYSG